MDNEYNDFEKNHDDEFFNDLNELLQYFIPDDSGFEDGKKMNFKTTDKNKMSKLKSKLELEIENMYVINNKEGDLIVVYIYNNKSKTFYMEEGHDLDIEFFNEQSSDIKREIITEMVNKNLFNENYYEFLDFMDSKDKEAMLTSLMDIAIESEFYEEAAVYRDMINR